MTVQTSIPVFVYICRYPNGRQTKRLGEWQYFRSPELLTEKGVHGDYGYGFSLVARSGGGHNKRATIKRSITRLGIRPAATAADARLVADHFARRATDIVYYYCRMLRVVSECVGG